LRFSNATLTNDAKTINFAYVIVNPGIDLYGTSNITVAPVLKWRDLNSNSGNLKFSLSSGTTNSNLELYCKSTEVINSVS
jgi:hypothetical protein